MQKLEESIGVHDKFQFEVKFTYPLNRKKPETAYRVDTYMFIPNNLRINRGTYTQADFYNDTQKYIRLKTPVMRLKEILNDKGSPLPMLEDAMRAVAKDQESEGKIYEFKYHLKMFCSILKSSLRDESAYVEKLPEDEDADKYVEKLVENTEDIAKEFRSLRKIFVDPHLDKKFPALYHFADEYMSLVITKQMQILASILDKPESPKAKKKTRAGVIELAEKEIKYREESKYPSTPDKDTDNEELVYRESILKKIMGSVLFLKTSASKEVVYLEQFLFAVAAGMSMIFATGVAFLFQPKVGEFTMTLFIILVVAYMFKDRIKELSRSYLSHKIHKHLYDHKINILSSFGEKIGHCCESFEFIRESMLPPEIVRARNRDYISELENGYVGEDIIFARKHIKLFGDKCAGLFDDFKVNGVNDIMRFNIKKFLEKMDNPNKDLFMPHDGEIIKISGRRVYHVNLVIKYGMDGMEDVYKKFRIIMSRNGIKRITEIPI